MLLLASSSGPVHYFKTHFLNNPFKGKYQPNWFDTALLVPYFLVLLVLASYGIHRYVMVYLYYRNRKKAVTAPASHFAELPRVTVQLPVFNEQFVVDRLVDAVCRLDYPREKLEIQVLDDSTDETVAVSRAAVERYAALGYDISLHHRTNRSGFKAGALQAGMNVAKGEFIAIFDADFVPPEDFLLRVIHYFSDPTIGMVQTRWTHINRHYSFLTEVESILLDGHFVLEHGARSRTGTFFNFNGTAGMWRRAAIEDAGGWQHDTLTEDTDLSYRAQLNGWKFVYLPELECPAEVPVEMTAFKTQQARWAKGLIQTSMKILPRVFRSDVPLSVKIEAWYHLTANISYPLMIVLAVLLLPAMIIRFYQGWFQMLYIDLPLFLASTCSISSFYLVSQRELFPKTWVRTYKYLPFLMALGIGLTITNAKAVIEALAGKQSAFARTPKYRVESRSDKPLARKYRRRLGWVPWVELIVGAYFAATIVYAIQNEN
ncbi:MAG TPA: cellulose synthase family protein, partial [Terriglobales bacterium]|nr:cellulose synthase family protein [Terriglobales bacterium]